MVWIWWDSSIVSSCSCSIVSKRLGKIVRQLAWPHEHLPSLIRSVHGLDLFSFGLGFCFSMGDSHQIPVGHVPQGVASSAHLLVHLIPSPDGGMVQGVDHSRVAPVEMGWVESEVSLDRLVKFVGCNNTHTTEHAHGSEGCLLASTHCYPCSHFDFSCRSESSNIKEWKPRQIDNPDYKGAWVHPEIDNPDYNPADAEGIAKYEENCKIGFDLWQVKSGTIFDNLIITDDPAAAKKAGEDLWAVTNEAEKKLKDEQDEEERKKADEEAKKDEDDEDADDLDADEEDERKKADEEAKKDE